MVMNITKMIESFQKNRVPYLRNHVLNPPNNHTAIISQWERWWIEDTNNSVANRGIFDAAIGCERKCADIMFLEQSSDKIFEIKGVAEIENNIDDDENKYLEKLETLKLYDESTNKFPNLEFVILSTLMNVDKNNTYIDFFSPLLNEAKNYSKESSLSWIIYILFCFDFTKESQEFHIPDYKPGYYNTLFGRYAEQGGYVILQNGKELSKVGWPEKMK